VIFKSILFIGLPLFLTGLLPGTAKPEMAVEDTGFEDVEITGLFSVGGKPMVSLSIRNSSSFTLSPGQRSRGIKLLQVKGDDDPFVVLERNGLRGRVFLNKSRPSVPVNRTISLSKLEKREGVQYVKGETEPFTGTAIGNYEDNSKWETPYKDGKRHGMQIVYRNEVLCEKRSYIDGKRDGIGIKYDSETGRKLCETLYKNGKLSLRMEYNRYGNLEQKELYENGKRSLRMKWDRFGKLVEKETY
jgi:hypothetical protein